MRLEEFLIWKTASRPQTSLVHEQRPYYRLIRLEGEIVMLDPNFYHINNYNFFYDIKIDFGLQ